MSQPNMSYNTLSYAVGDDGVLLLTLNRPEQLNSFTVEMANELVDAFNRASDDDAVRAIVVTGAGKAFCAGLDLASQMGKKENLGVLDAGSDMGAEFDLRTAPPVVLHNLDTPTICSINGGAAGYGLDLAFGCDIRIASTTAKLAPGFAKRGILPESGGTWLLPRMVGYAKAAEICFTGRTLSAAEGLELGLVNHIVAPEELHAKTYGLADEIASNAPLAVRAIKRMMRAAETETFEQNIHHVFLQLLPLFKTQDFKEGVASFMEKRPANITGR